MKTIFLFCFLFYFSCAAQSSSNANAKGLTSDPAATGNLNKEGLVLIDLVVLKEGVSLEERARYEETIASIAKRYGMERTQSYQINKRLAGTGPAQAVYLNLWNVPDPELLSKFTEDPAYQEQIPWRNKLHDMEKVTLLLAKPLQSGAQINRGSVLVDFIVLNEGFGAEEREIYQEKTVQVASKYGVSIAQSYEIVQFLGGQLHKDVAFFNLWSLPDPSVLGKVVEDPEYKKNIEARDKIHNMSEVTMYLAQPK